MPRSSVRVLLVSVVALIASACRESEPEALYNLDLGGDTYHLLPETGIVHRAHDPGVNRGSSRADLYQLGDEAPPPEPERTGMAGMAGMAGDMPPATGVGSALSNVGKALLGNLMYGKPGDVVETADGSGDSEEADGGEQAPAPADLQGVEGVVAELNAAFAGRRFPNITPLCVERQRSTAGKMFEVLDELNASVDSLLDAYEQTVAGSKARFETRIAEVGAPLSLSGLVATGADAVRGELARSGGASVSVSFEREGSDWRIVYPSVPESAEWPGLESSLNDKIDRLDDLLVEVQSGSADQAKVEAAIEEAIQSLFQFDTP